MAGDGVEIHTRSGSEHFRSENFVARQNSQGLFYSEIGTVSSFINDKSVGSILKILFVLKIRIHELLLS